MVRKGGAGGADMGGLCGEEGKNGMGIGRKGGEEEVKKKKKEECGLSSDVAMKTIPGGVFSQTQV